MIKGIQKRMIVMRTGGSSIFEGAYFVLRNGYGRTDAEKGEMIREANRLIEEGMGLPAGRRGAAGGGRRKGVLGIRWRSFIAGAIFGAFLFSAAALMLYFF